MKDWTDLLERALRIAATAHQDQQRKASGLPYITHPVAVAMLLQAYGFSDEQILAAALLHDVVEDTQVSLDDLAGEFPAAIVDLVGHLTERKLDPMGGKRPWEDRKREHLVHIAVAPLAARAIVLADKLHNLRTMSYDLDEGQEVSTRFNAAFERLVWYYESMIEAAAGRDGELQDLAVAARTALQEIRQRVKGT
jgi:guanosine-3',5'-bis(diphosphate) 3'-pyrophosphohydrolase